MFRTITMSISLLAFALAGLMTVDSAQAAYPNCNYVYPRPQPAPPQTGYEALPHPLYKHQSTTRRTQVISGTKITLCANFLGSETGFALLNYAGTSAECNIVEWAHNTVTVEIPRMGLSSPKDAEIELLLPSGRIIKVFAVLLVSPPDVITHASSVSPHVPPAPIARPTTHITAVQGGFLLQASIH